MNMNDPLRPNYTATGTLATGVGVGADVHIQCRAEVEQLRGELDRLSDHYQKLMDECDAKDVVIEGLRADWETLAKLLADTADERAVADEARKLEALDHGVGWPDLCHAVHVLDRDKAD